MPDITMCTNDTCPLRFDCLRSEASGTRPSSLQSLAHFTPYEETAEDGNPGEVLVGCDYFMNLGRFREQS